mgnify:CR=1 FL=1
MYLKVWKDEIWKASTGIKAYLREFFSNLLKGKLGKEQQHRHGHQWPSNFVPLNE